MEGAEAVTPGPTRPPGILHIRENTQKLKFLPSQAFKWKKKLPDHFKLEGPISKELTQSLYTNSVDPFTLYTF